MAAMEWLEAFNNRERAVAVWLAVFITWALTRRSIREALWAALKSALHPKLALSWVAMLAYVGTIVTLLQWWRFWDGSLIKDTVYWVVGVGGVSLVQVGSGGGTKGLKAALRGAVGVTIALEFVVDLHTFSLLVEMVLVPLAALLVGMSVVAGASEEYTPVRKALDGLLGVLGLFLIAKAVSGIMAAPEALVTADTARLFALPPLLTVLYLPFLYAYGLFVTYESLFIRLGFFLKDDPALRSFAKRRIILACRANLWALERFSRFGPARFSGLEDRADVAQMVDDFRAKKG